MRVPRNYKGMTRKQLTAGLAALAAVMMGAPPTVRAADKQPVPAARISLEKLGFPGVSAGFVNVGASVLTVNFLDNGHLLVTFGMRGLVKRLKDDPETDEDREVAAEVVDVPSGKIEARTEWHLHDHGRYLWPIGQGRFMLRIGGELSTLAPLANLHTEPFRRVSFPGRGLNLAFIGASPEGGVLTVESQIPRQHNGVANWADEQMDGPGTVLDLYRVSGVGSEASPLTITSPHSVRSSRPMLFPVDEDGFLWATNEPRDPNDWTVSFHAFAPGGKKNPMPVGQIHSSCQPRMLIASRSEYITLTCLGVDTHMKLSTYGFDGHENWEEPIDLDSSIAFAFAPSAGRFAVSRIAASVTPVSVTNGLPDDPTFRQEVRIYQTESGDLLLKATTSPALKTAENFDLSADGRMAALVRDGQIQIYQLPEPSDRDRKASADVAKFAPPPGDNTELTRAGVVVREQPGETVAGSAPRVAAPVVTGGSAVAASVPGASMVGASNPTAADNAAQATRPVTAVEAAPAPTPARKPPTLLLPGEQAEFKDKKTDSRQ
jgi:hypothetical protein